MPYILPEHQKDLVEFKYKGGTASLTYEYLWSPFAQFLLKFVPEWVAPNLITLIAFLIVVFSHLIFMLLGKEGFTEGAPHWKMVLFAATMFVYQHLDNLDGKQARKTSNYSLKTESSSPIGMLFDHGADALTSILFGIQIAKILYMKDEQLCIYAVIVIVMLPNFAGLWVQYSVGEFKLDRINPIDEGLPSYMLLCLFGCVFDYTKWNDFHWIASYNIEFLLMFGAIVVFVVANMCKNVFRLSHRQKDDVIHLLWLPAVLIVVLALIKLTGENWIYQKHFYAILYTLLFFWGRSMMLMQVSSVTKQKCNVFNRGTNFFMLSMGMFIAFNSIMGSYAGVYLWTVCFIQFLILAEFIHSFLIQASTILKINIFRIPHGPKNAKKE